MVACQRMFVLCCPVYFQMSCDVEVRHDNLNMCSKLHTVLKNVTASCTWQYSFYDYYLHEITTLLYNNCPFLSWVSFFKRNIHNFLRVTDRVPSAGSHVGHRIEFELWSLIGQKNGDVFVQQFCTAIGDWTMVGESKVSPNGGQKSNCSAHCVICDHNYQS
jgi:hypothetical protein